MLGRGKPGLGTPYGIERLRGRSHKSCYSAANGVPAALLRRQTKPTGLALFSSVPSPSFPLCLRPRAALGKSLHVLPCRDAGASARASRRWSIGTGAVLSALSLFTPTTEHRAPNTARGACAAARAVVDVDVVAWCDGCGGAAYGLAVLDDGLVGRDGAECELVAAGDVGGQGDGGDGLTGGQGLEGCGDVVAGVEHDEAPRRRWCRHGECRRWLPGGLLGFRGATACRGSPRCRMPDAECQMADARWQALCNASGALRVLCTANVQDLLLREDVHAAIWLSSSSAVDWSWLNGQGKESRTTTRTMRTPFAGHCRLPPADCRLWLRPKAAMRGSLAVAFGSSGFGHWPQSGSLPGFELLESLSRGGGE